MRGRRKRIVGRKPAREREKREPLVECCCFQCPECPAGPAQRVGWQVRCVRAGRAAARGTPRCQPGRRSPPPRGTRAHPSRSRFRRRRRSAGRRPSRHVWTAASATGLSAGPESPPVIRRAAAPASGGRSRAPRSVFVSTSASAPPCSAARRWQRGRRLLGESLTQSGRSVARPAEAHDGLRLGGVAADRDAAALDVRAGDVELERGDARLAVEPPAGQLVVGVLEAADRHDQRAPERPHRRQHRVGERRRDRDWAGRSS